MKKIIGLSVLGIVSFIGLSLIYLTVLKTYAIDQVEIQNGTSTHDLVTNLQDKGINLNFKVFRLVQKINGHGIMAGTYVFVDSPTLMELSRTLDQGTELYYGKKLVIPEGYSNAKIIAELKTLNLVNFDLQEFERLAKPFEGYLFPDTYYLDDTITPVDLIATMRANFKTKTDNITPPLTNDEIILASIIEREVNNPTDRRMVADILQRRLAEGMRLQVDATLNYYLNKTSDELTLGDLETEHPYNTYTNSGLPPSPIANPGLESLQAVRNPIKNEYWYYLSDNDGKTYYARSLEDHVENRRFLE